MNSKIKGTLRAIKSDYCVLESDNGVSYYPLHHVKGLTQVIEDNQDDGSQTDENGKQNQNQKEEAIIVPGRRFVDVLDRLKYEECQINQGPHKIKGTVMGRAGDHLIMEVDDEVLYIPLHHVQSFSWNYNDNNDDSDNNNNSDNSNNNNNNNNKNNNNQNKNGGDNGKNNKNNNGNKQKNNSKNSK